MHLFNNDTLKWESEGKLYCLHIQMDNDPMNPRRDWDNVTTMACFHNRYDLGDDLPYKSPEEFWQHLVRENVSKDEIYQTAKAGKLEGIRCASNVENPCTVDIYEGGDLVYDRIPKDLLVDYLMEDLTIAHCMVLMQPYAEWLPLWIYEHSGISMSCGDRINQYADRWDSYGVGWIICLKKGFCETVCEESAWRERAVKTMQTDVKIYDNFLCEDVYGYTLYEAVPVDESGSENPEWTEVDSCWGFYGSDTNESQILDDIGHGLDLALSTGNFTTGEAKLHHISYYTF